MTIVRVKFSYPENSQRNDFPWSWNGVDISGGAMCQGNSNENALISIIQEFDIDLKIPNTWTYYSLIIPLLAVELDRSVRRSDIMNYKNHAIAINRLLEEYKIPVVAQAWAIPNDARFIHDAIERTGRPVAVGGLWTKDGHWRSYHESDDILEMFKCNDSWGEPPYNTPEKKKKCSISETWQQAEDATLRRAITYEDK